MVVRFQIHGESLVFESLDERGKGFMEFWRWRFLFIIGPTGGMLVECENAVRSRYPIVSTYLPFIVGQEEKKKETYG